VVDPGDGPVKIPLLASASGVSVAGSMAPPRDGLTMSPCADSAAANSRRRRIDKYRAEIFRIGACESNKKSLYAADRASAE
jgi:hypothetical protein